MNTGIMTSSAMDSGMTDFWEAQGLLEAVLTISGMAYLVTGGRGQARAAVRGVVQ